jgi:hypothetical protein
MVVKEYRTTRPCSVRVHVDMDDERFGQLIHYLGTIHLDFEVEEENPSIVEFPEGP